MNELPKRADGPIPYPQRRLNPAFRDAVRLVMRDRIRQTALALSIGIPQQSGLSVLLRLPFPATPLTISRLEKLAEIVGFTGPMFAEDPESVGAHAVGAGTEA